MKKIALFSLIACLGFIDGSFAAGQACRKTSTGKVICNYIDRGGGYEEGLCWKRKASPDEPNPDSNIWEDNGSGEWWLKKIGTDCTAGMTGAKKAVCFNNAINSYGNDVHRSCGAWECKPDYLLYTTNVKSRQEIEVVGTSQKVGSQGLCRERSYLKNLCDVGCGCDKNEKCVLNEVTVKNHGKNVKAFIGEELCVCVADGNGDNSGDVPVVPGKDPNVNPIPGEGDCTLVLNVEVTCPDGFRYTKGKKIKLKKSENDGLICPNDEEIEINSVKDLEKYISKICDGHNNLAGNAGGGASGDDDMAVARKTLVEFFKNTEDNKNVWRDEEGKFNTVRLASDLTAGVVLGTVGGVVSGVVIKKKQVEKGFDALHCTVGGQNIADWGDTFNVGLRR